MQFTPTPYFDRKAYYCDYAVIFPPCHGHKWVVISGHPTIRLGGEFRRLREAKSYIREVVYGGA